MSAAPPAGAAPAIEPPLSEIGAAAATPRVRQLLSDYLELTKPKVQSLLLLTTIATMYVAGDPSPLLVALTCLGGYLSAGGAGAGNHWVDRDIDARMAAAATRPTPAGAGSPRAVAHGQPARRRTLVLRLPRLRVRLHRLVEATHAAEHRDRWRSRRGPTAGRLGGGDRLGERHGGDPVLHRVLLDAPALLGAVAADEGRVPQGGRADAARGAGGGRDAPTDPAVRGAPVRRHPAAVLRGGLRDGLPGLLAGARPRLHRRRGSPLSPRRPGLGAA